MNRSAKALQFQMEKESLQSELQTVTLELKRLTPSKMKAKKEVKVKGSMVKQTKAKTLLKTWQGKEVKARAKKFEKNKSKTWRKILWLLSTVYNKHNKNLAKLRLPWDIWQIQWIHVLEARNCLDDFFENSSTIKLDISSICDDVTYIFPRRIWMSVCSRKMELKNWSSSS